MTRGNLILIRRGLRRSYQGYNILNIVRATGTTDIYNLSLKLSNKIDKFLNKNTKFDVTF